MNNFLKIFSAVIIFGLLGLGACVSSMSYKPKEEGCIAIIPKYAEKCGPNAKKDSQPDCLGGEEFICVKTTPSNSKRVPIKSPSPVPTFTPTPITPATPEVPAEATPVPVDEAPVPVETMPVYDEGIPVPMEMAPVPEDIFPEPEETVPMEPVPATGMPYMR
jgi:hypothetical protein